MKLNVALVAHDQKKQDLAEWAKYNKESLIQHHLIATGTTGSTLETVLDVPIERLHSGPLGGDQEIGAKIVNDLIDVLIFFWDPMDAHPHEPDVRALLRLAVLYNIPTASNRKTADMLISSSLFGEHIKREAHTVITASHA